MKTYIFLFFIFYLQSVHGQNTVEPLPDIESKGLTISEPVDTLVYTTVQVPPGFPSGPKGLKAFTDQKVKENTTPANMASPPKVGMLDLCDFLSPGSSYRFFITATLIMEGIAKKVIIKEVMQPKVILFI